ncbi:hypothetical protein [Synechococcus sp. M16CYN]
MIGILYSCDASGSVEKRLRAHSIVAYRNVALDVLHEGKTLALGFG